jgi:alanine dehydrogenase
MTSVVARTATHAFNNAAWEYMRSVVTLGLRSAVENHPALGHGVLLHDGKILDPSLATQFGVQEDRL